MRGRLHALPYWRRLYQPREEAKIMTKYRPQDGSGEEARFRRLLSVTMSGGERTTQRNRGSIVADTVGFCAFLLVLLLIFVALP
jgi:hypothetical protein